MADKKRIPAYLVPAAAGIIITLILFLVITASTSVEVLIKDREGRFFRARALFVAGSALVCRRDTTGFSSKKEALQNKDTGRSIALLSLKRIEFIEIISSPEDEGSALGAWQPSLKDFIGDYSMNAAGNRGYLSLRASGGYLYGTIRFPDWGRGATEYLKNVGIASGKLYFTRSATTRQELARLGATAYFTQYYSGEYLRSGNLIRGYYTVQGVRKPWEAVKTK
jgi:hypothetical protein